MRCRDYFPGLILFTAGWFLVVSPLAAETLSGRELFIACAGCHAPEPGTEQPMGPSLEGLAGRIAGTQPGYNYSPALADSGIRWDRATLMAWILQTETMVPGTWMLYANHLDAGEVARLTDYLLDENSNLEP